ncbi:response regulator transcription factor [Streptomyces sp. NPDC056112]|uniref:response regulator transcription factor n=1 Tax=Streptomyces sp. NPDC056112 TaxID=3345715 RepID=UPI0035E03324
MKPLTRRQREAILLVAAGRPNVQIAALLGITPNSVGEILSAAYRRLGANDRAHAVTLAIFRGEIGHFDLARIAHETTAQEAA